MYEITSNYSTNARQLSLLNSLLFYAGTFTRLMLLKAWDSKSLTIQDTYEDFQNVYFYYKRPAPMFHYILANFSLINLYTFVSSYISLL